jgi:hypothetical protein
MCRLLGEHRKGLADASTDANDPLATLQAADVPSRRDYQPARPMRGSKETSRQSIYVFPLSILPLGIRLWLARRIYFGYGVLIL